MTAGVVESADMRRTDSVTRRGYLHLSGAAAVGVVGAAVDTTATHEVGDVRPENRLSVVGTDSTPSTFEVTVSEEIVPIHPDDALSTLGRTGRSAEDTVLDGAKYYRFRGDITHVRLDDGLRMAVDGERTHLGDATSDATGT